MAPSIITAVAAAWYETLPYNILQKRGNNTRVSPEESIEANKLSHDNNKELTVPLHPTTLYAKYAFIPIP